MKPDTSLDAVTEQVRHLRAVGHPTYADLLEAVAAERDELRKEIAQMQADTAAGWSPAGSQLHIGLHSIFGGATAIKAVADQLAELDAMRRQIENSPSLSAVLAYDSGRRAGLEEAAKVADKACRRIQRRADSPDR